MATVQLEKSGLVEELLFNVAQRIQLSPTDYRLAAQHYVALEQHLQRDGSPLQNVAEGLYAQGSIAIGAVVSSKFENDEFDVDAIVQLAIAASTAPAAVLDTLFDAIQGDRGSIYYGKVTRHTRCVTVDYQNMHVDLTPAVLLPYQAPRTSVIFHARSPNPSRCTSTYSQIHGDLRIGLKRGYLRPATSPIRYCARRLSLSPIQSS